MNRDDLIKQIIAHLEGKSSEYRSNFEKLLAAGATWEPSTPNAMFWFGRTLLLSEDGEYEEV